MVFKEYYKFLNVFSKVISDKITLLYKGTDYKIKLITNLDFLNYSLLYKITLPELKIYKKYIYNYLKRGLIKPSLIL